MDNLTVTPHDDPVPAVERLSAEESYQLLGHGRDPSTLNLPSERGYGTLPRPNSNTSMSSSDLQKSLHTPTSFATDADVHFRVHAVYEEFADRVRQAWMRPLRGGIHVRCSQVRDSSFGAVVLGMEAPTCAHIFTIPPLDGRVLLEIPSWFALALIERLLGGGLLQERSLKRPLSELERRLILRLTSPLTQIFSNALQGQLAQRAELERIENNPRVIRCFHLAEPLVVGRIGITLPATAGEIRLAIPRRCMLDGLRSELLGCTS
jgi:flagellar motor switch protein FliM